MKRITKHRKNVIIDTAAFVFFFFLTTTGVLLKYLLPPGSGHFTKIWGLDRHAWGDIHFWVAVGFFGTLALHLFLHWRWIRSTLRKRSPETEPGAGIHFGLGALGLVTVILLGISPLISPVEVDPNARPAGKNVDNEQKTSLEENIRGYMTLEEVCNASKVPVTDLLEALHLPADLDPHSKLGTLRQQYGFTMDEIRQKLDSLKKR